MQKRFVDSLRQFEAILETEIEELPEEKRIVELPNIFLKLSGLDRLMSADPFAEEYEAEIRKLFSEITGVETYSPEINEKSPWLENADPLSFISPYNYGESSLVGELLSTYGLIIKALDVKRGDSVLEYGPGTGGIAIPLARMGCRVSVIDIDANCLEAIKKQSEMFGAGIRTKHALFGDNVEEGDRYDRILFYESFHHCLDHQKVIHKLGDMLSEGGMIYFAGEPILDRDSYFLDAVPYPWGPRLDGLSLRAMKTYGWCELGFRENYFVYLLLRNGFIVKKYINPHNSRANYYTAEINTGVIDISKGHLISSVNPEHKLYNYEKDFVWTGACAEIPLDRKNSWSTMEIFLFNPSPIPRNVEIYSGEKHSIKFAPTEKKSLRIRPGASAGDLLMRCRPFVPSKTIRGSADARELGIAIERIEYRR